MEKTVRDRLVGALKQLGSSSLDSFRNKLTDCTVKEGYERIRYGELENANPEVLTNLILRYYKESYGVEITVNALNAINEKVVAEELEKSLGKGSLASSSEGKSFVQEDDRMDLR